MNISIWNKKTSKYENITGVTDIYLISDNYIRITLNDGSSLFFDKETYELDFIHM